MLATEALWRQAEEWGVVVVWERLLPRWYGLYVWPGMGGRRLSRPYIILEPWLQTREPWLRVTLAHELGHHATYLRWMRCGGPPPWAEEPADRWAMARLMPAKAFRRVQDCDDETIAQRFGVPVYWVQKRRASLVRRWQARAGRL